MIDPSEGAERAELIRALNRFTDRADAVLKGSTHQTVTLSGGSLGMWLGTFFSSVTFIMFCVVLMLFVNHDRKIDDLGDYLAAIYMAAPQLKVEAENARSTDKGPE